MKSIILGIIVLLLAVSLVGTIADEVYNAKYDNLNENDANQTATNVSGVTAVLLTLISLVFGASIVFMAYNQFIAKK